MAWVAALPYIGQARARRDLWPRCARTLAGRAASSCHRFSARPAGCVLMLTTLWFLLSAGAIYAACEYFVNGIEWLGRKCRLDATATGTVLAAFGTALPESAVTFIAVVFGNTPGQRDIGVGAALGGPLVLGTIAYAVVGIALWSNRHRLRRPDTVVKVDN